MAYSYGSLGGGHHGGGGITGFLSNLGKDVKDAALGLPQGIKQTVEHPIGTAKAVGKSEWAEWSPLFHGHVAEFGHAVYDHPLAPLLDIATVFTGGASVAAKLGVHLAEHGLIDETSALAKLGKPGAIKVADTTGAGRPTLTKYTSSNPLHRAAYETAFNAATKYEQHLPSWFTKHVFGQQATYERLHHVEVAHRSAALGMQLSALMKAGQTLDQIGKLPEVEQTLLAHNYFSMVRHARTIKADQPLPKGWTYVRNYDQSNKDTLFFQHSPSQDFATFKERLSTLGNRFTTDTAEKAATANSGKLLKIVPHHDARNLGLEAERSATFLRKLWRAPTRIWKSILLGYSPRVVINNGVGNWLMYAMRQGGGHAVRGFVDAVRFTKSEKDAAAMLGETGRLADQHWLRKHFGDELGNTFVRTQLQEGAKAPSVLSGPFYPLVHKLADEPVRAAAISAYMRGAPEVRSLMKTKGLTFDQAVGSALAKNTGLRDRAALHARTIAGDYFTASPVERAIRDVVPFYLWDKHIVKHVANLVNERPGRLAVAAAVGANGADVTRKQLGDIPDYLLSAIPFGHAAGGRLPVLSTTGLNPYSTIPDLVDATLAATTGGADTSAGEAIGSQINPVLGALIEQVSGHNLSTGGAVQTKGGVVPSALSSVAEGLPIAQIIQRATGGPVHTKNPTLYAHDTNEAIASLAGVPIKLLNPQRAHQLAAEQTKKKKSKYTFGDFSFSS